MGFMEFVRAHSGELMAMGGLALTLVGALLPAQSPFGQIVRRLAVDLANKNLRSLPPGSRVLEDRGEKVIVEVPKSSVDLPTDQPWLRGGQ